MTFEGSNSIPGNGNGELRKEAKDVLKVKRKVCLCQRDSLEWKEGSLI